ncbi:MAG: putative DNA-binding domain-containing protein [Alphaproteobacteria bacterium]
MTYRRQLEILQGGVMNRDREAALKIIRPARHNEFTPAMRLHVYAYAYSVRLVDATAVDYPAVKHHMGEEAYKQAVRAFVESQPSGLWDLNRYPIAFSAFVKEYSDDSFAYEIALLEGTITEVFWGAESKPLPAGDFASQPEEAFASTVLKPRAASKLLEFDHPVNNYLIAFRADEKPAKPAAQKQYIYLYRHNDKAMREVLDEAAYLLLKELFAGKPVGQALEDLTTARPELAETIAANLAAWFQEWFEKGFFLTNN